MNAGPISNGVSSGYGNAYGAVLEETDLLADSESHDHGSLGDHGGTIHGVLHVHTPPSTMHPQLERVTQTILTKTADQAVFSCYNTKAVKGYDRRLVGANPGSRSVAAATNKSSRG